MKSAAQDQDTLRIALDAWGAGGTMREKIERLWDEREVKLQRLEAILYPPELAEARRAD